MKALILCGGMGTRLRPLTLDRPKPLLPVVNVPFMSYQLALLRKHECHEAVLCTADSLVPYQGFIQNQKKIGSTLLCSKESKELGTAGAIKNAEKFIDSETAFIFNGDVLTDMHLTEMLQFHKAKKAVATIALVEVFNPSDYGLILTAETGAIHEFIEKPKDLNPFSQKRYLINAGVYLFEKKIFDLIPKGKKYSVERELFPDCLRRKLPMFGFVLSPSIYWLDIGTPEKYLQANLDLLSGRLKHVIDTERLIPVAKNSKISPDAQIEKNVILGENCKIEKGCMLKECVLMDGVSVGENARIEKSIVGSKTKIGRHCILNSLSVVGHHSILTPFSQLNPNFEIT